MQVTHVYKAMGHIHMIIGKLKGWHWGCLMNVINKFGIIWSKWEINSKILLITILCAQQGVTPGNLYAKNFPTNQDEKLYRWPQQANTTNHRTGAWPKTNGQTNKSVKGTWYSSKHHTTSWELWIVGMGCYLKIFYNILKRVLVKDYSPSSNNVLPATIWPTQALFSSWICNVAGTAISSSGTPAGLLSSGGPGCVAHTLLLANHMLRQYPYASPSSWTVILAREKELKRGSLERNMRMSSGFWW